MVVDIARWAAVLQQGRSLPRSGLLSRSCCFSVEADNTAAEQQYDAAC